MLFYTTAGQTLSHPIPLFYNPASGFTIISHTSYVTYGRYILKNLKSINQVQIKLKVFIFVFLQTAMLQTIEQCK